MREFTKQWDKQPSVNIHTKLANNKRRHWNSTIGKFYQTGKIVFLIQIGHNEKQIYYNF